VPDDAYALIDAGDGRRLERFGDLLTDRPAPGATEPRRAPERWADAAIFHTGSGWWAADGMALGPEGHPLTLAGISLEIRPAAGGQVGLFPEHLANSAWLAGVVRARTGSPGTRPPDVLNLFAYTGLATLVAAAAGARVVHADASRPAVAWARRNAELSGLADRAGTRRPGMSALDYVRESLRDPSAFKVPGYDFGSGEIGMPDLGLSNEEIEKLAAFLLD